MTSSSSSWWIGIVIVASSACTEPSGARIAPSVTAELQLRDSAEVLIHLREALPDHASPERRAAIARVRNAVLSSLGHDIDLSHQYRDVSAIAGRIAPAALARLRDDDDVSYVQSVLAGHGQLLEAVPAIGVDQLRGMFGLTGRGVRVATLDSGVDLEHPDLQGAVVAQRCFARNACAPGWADQGTNAADTHGHGTAVAGTIASRGMRSPPGFAPEAEIVAVKVQNSENHGYVSDWVAGLEWIHDNLPELKVDVVNLGVGTDTLFDAAQCDQREPALAHAIQNLIDAGVIVIGPAGNQGSTSTLPAPGCNTGVITVGATYDAAVGAQPASGATFTRQLGSDFDGCRDEDTQAGQIACYTNTPERVDLVAPGGPMLTDKLGGETTTAWGTSQAGAVVSGVAALLRQCNPALQQAELKRALVDTGEPREAAKSGRSFPWLRAVETAKVACPNLVPSGAPAANGGSAAMPPASAAGEPGFGRRAGAKPAQPAGARTRSADELYGKYTGDAPASAWDQDQAPIGPGTREQGDETRAADVGRRDRGARAGEEHGESVSSCGVHGTGAGLGRGWLGLAVIVWLGVRRRRVGRRRG